jgi:hypothetical protein
VAEPAAEGRRPGTVVDVDPDPGVRVRPGRVVELHYVKHGPPRPGGGSDEPRPAATTTTGGPPATPPPPPPVAVPAVQGLDVFAACGAVQATGLQCVTVPGKAPARPFVIHTQGPAAGTAVPPGNPVQVHYDDTQPAALFRIKRLHTNVWVIGTDQAHIQQLVASGRYINQVTLGQAYPCCTRGVGHLRSIWSFRRSDTPHDGDNRRYSADPTPPGPNWVSSGEVGQVLAQPVAGAVPLYRLVKRHDGTADFSYATPADVGYYEGRSFVIDETIGWIWP